MLTLAKQPACVSRVELDFGGGSLCLFVVVGPAAAGVATHDTDGLSECAFPRQDGCAAWLPYSPALFNVSASVCFTSHCALAG